MSTVANPNDYLMYLKTTQAGTMKAVFAKVAISITECTLLFLPNEDVEEEPDGEYYEEIDGEIEEEEKTKKKKKQSGGIRIHQLSQNHVVMFKIDLYANKFDEFYCEEMTTVAVDVPVLCNIFNTIANNDVLCMYIMKSDPSFLNISSIRRDNDEKHGGNKDIQLSLAEAQYEKIPLNKIKAQKRMYMSITSFHRACKNAMEIKASVTEILAVNNEVKFHSFADTLNYKETFTDPNYSGNDDGVIVRSRFSTPLLFEFSKNNNDLCKKLIINVRNDYPLIIEYKASTLGKIYVIIAPHDPESE